jgi:uncharacterized oxidoreductase
MHIPADKLNKLLQVILQHGGSDEYEAEIVADHLIQANLRGHDSHGIMMVSWYMDWVKEGNLKPNTPARKVKDEGAFLVFDGRRGYGQRTAREALDAGIIHCRETGMAIVTLKDSGHIGRLGTYGEQAAEAGLVSLHFANAHDSPLVVAPVGGKKPLFMTNPICFAMPGTDKTAPIVMDYATSSMAYGKAAVYMNKGISVPLNSIVDHAGRPTTDPKVLFEEPYGSLLPFGGHKGYGLMIFCELLAGCLSGGGPVNTYRQESTGTVNNLFSILIDSSRLVDQPRLQQLVDGLADYITACPPVNQDQPVMMPGDIERATLIQRQKEGIPMDDHSWAGVLTACDIVGLSKESVKAIINYKPSQK